KYGDSDGYTFDDPILILEILSRRFLLRGIYLITGSSKDGDGDTSFQWSQFTTQCSHLMFPNYDGGVGDWFEDDDDGGRDLWHIILNGDFPPVAKNEVTQILEVVPFEEQSDDLKKKLAKNNEAKMVLYNVLPKKEYERIFMCKTAKDIWKSLLITHQGNSQVKDNKIDLLVQQYEQFTILEEEYIDSGFARFNTIITSLKALDECFSSKNYVRKFLRALHPKWRAKVTVIEESKDLSSLVLDELISNLKVHDVVMKKDSEIYRGKKERIKFIALKAKKESSDDEIRHPIAMTKNMLWPDEKKGKSDRKCFRCGDPNHLIGDCPKPSRNKDQKAFIGGSWSDSENEAEEKTNDETCLMAQSSNESPSFKIGLGFDSSKASTSGTKIMSFVESSAEKAMDGSTMPGSVSRTNGEIVT
ncbi:zf-CCHC domain-containing protein, partial [Tanacetum coccineum]